MITKPQTSMSANENLNQRSIFYAHRMKNETEIKQVPVTCRIVSHSMDHVTRGIKNIALRGTTM